MQFNKRLLPIGFYDLYEDDALKSYEYTKICIENFINHDYKLIKTSIVEFEDSFQKTETVNNFKVVDAISKKNIFFRNDITTQISKIITDSNPKIRKEAPLKLCYYGDIINLNIDDLYCERMQTQVGCEIIGNDDINSCYQVISSTLKSIIFIKNLNINISLPNLLEFILPYIKTPNKNILKNSIINKSLTEVKNLAPNDFQIINEIILSSSDLSDITKKINDTFNDKNIADLLNIANELMLKIAKNFPSIKINFDLFGDNNFGYHNKVTFDIFVEDFRYAIAKGGCYLIKTANDSIASVGSTIYINFLSKI
jgi:ATP phosphoribosyltransferase regulatory subunit